MNPKFFLLLLMSFMINSLIVGQECNVDGGTLTFENQDTVYSICVGDGIQNPFDVSLTGAVGDSQVWVVTDTLGEILDLPESTPFNFEGAGVGTCLIWNLSYSDSLNGLAVGASASELSGCYDLSNAIALIRSQNIQGGFIQFRDTLQDATFCAGSTDGDSIDVEVSGQTGSLSTWLITDTLANILAIEPSPPFNFSSAGPGVCRIWHLSHEAGLQGLAVDNNASQLDGCFGLSNFIEIIRSELKAGSLMTRDTMMEMTLCPGDEASKSVDLIVDEGAGSGNQWVITNGDGIILELPVDLPLDLSNIVDDECFIWRLTFDGPITGLAIGEHVDDIKGCHSFSNSINIIKSEIDGGRIFLPGNKTQTTICLGDNLTELKYAYKSGATGGESAWVITTKDGYIKDLPKAPPFSFEREDPDTCLIWHVSYDGELTGLEEGMHTSNLKGCFGLSNFISVVKAEVEAGQISLRDSTQTAFSICSAVDDTTEVDVIVNSLGSGEDNIWVITDEEGVITQLPDDPPFSFGGAEGGLNYIWMLTYTGEIDGVEEGHAVEDIDGCYTLSNSIEVNLSGGAEAGVLTTRDGGDVVTICIDDNSADPVDVDLQGASTDFESVWLITDEDGEILDIPGGPPFDFTGAGAGVCFVYHLVYIDSISGLEIGGELEELFGCYDLSNYIRVKRKVNACNASHLIEFGEVSDVGSDWMTVELQHEYESMVVVATPQLPDVLSRPVVTRVRNAAGNSFELRVQNPGGNTAPANYKVQYIVAEEGVYLKEIDGIDMEARKEESDRTSRKGRWLLEPRDYENRYDEPVVLGQVMSQNDSLWSVFWSSGERRKIYSPNSYSLSATKHVGEDEIHDRSDETIGMIIMEAGTYNLDGFSWHAGITPKAIRGVDETNNGFIQETELAEISGGVMSSYGMRGSNYGWPVFIGEQAFEGKNFRLAVDEDQIRDLERRHPREEIAFVVFGSDESRIQEEEELEVSIRNEEQELDNNIDQLIQEFGGFKLFPNPASDRFSVQFEAPKNELMTMHIYDMQGKILSSWHEPIVRGLNILVIEDHKLENGMYNLMMVTSDGIKQQQKFIILR